MPNEQTVKVLFIGDIVGKPGRRALKTWLPVILKKEDVDLVIANGENGAGGFGLTREVALEIMNTGVDVITTGNHIWDKKEFIPVLDELERVVRPANYPPGVPGYGWVQVRTPAGIPVIILNLEGRIFMNPLDCPFRKAIEIWEAHQDIIIITDFHAEATSEKMALAWHLDGKVSAVVGTHTHVQTADEQILPWGTAYISDVGMTGPSLSVIGMNPQEPLKRFLTHLPNRFQVAKGPMQLNGVTIDVDINTRKALSIKRIFLREEDED
jgi:metallophosphoesterase (TIGR00282 family)